MTDYTKTTNFTAKDGLSTGDPLKVIKGSYFDTEFDNLATHIATKYDSGDLASQAQAEAETVNTVLMTPLRVANWADANSGIIGDIQALADPNADRIPFWDDSAGAGAWLSVGGGLEIVGTTLSVADALAGNGLTMTANVLDVVGGAGITANADDIQITDVTAGANNPVNISSGTFTFDITALAAVEADGLASTDTFVVDDAGTAKKISVEHMGMRVQTGQGTQTLAAADANTIMEFNGTATVTLPADATHTWPPGAACIICVDHATQQVTVDAAASVILNSVFHPGGGSSSSDVVLAGGSAVVMYLGSDEWYISGDIAD